MNIKITLWEAFGTGGLSFLGACMLPLLPGYYSYLLAVSRREPGDNPKSAGLRLLPYSLSLLLGFSVTFIFLRSGPTPVGKVLDFRSLFSQQLGGVVLIFLGLIYSGALVFLRKFSRGFYQQLTAYGRGKSSALLVGFSLATAWSACFSPLLGSILIGATFEATGILLVAAYTAGLALPLLVSTFILGWIYEFLDKMVGSLAAVRRTSGLILVGTGILFVTDTFYKLQYLF